MKLSDLSNEPGDARSAREAKEFTDGIEEMLNDGAFHWAEDTLQGIYETVSSSGKVTPGQRRAVENIEAKRPRR